MTQYQVPLDAQTLQQVFSGDSQLAHLLESVLNQVLEAQVSEQLHAERYERTADRQGYRNGVRPRKLTTCVGQLTLRVPQVRDGEFSTELFARYQPEPNKPSSWHSWRWWSTASPRAKWPASPRSGAGLASPSRPSRS